MRSRNNTTRAILPDNKPCDIGAPRIFDRTLKTSAILFLSQYCQFCRQGAQALLRNENESCYMPATLDRFSFGYYNNKNRLTCRLAGSRRWMFQVSVALTTSGRRY